MDQRTYNFIMLSVLLLLLGWNPLASAVHHPGDFIHTSRRGQFLKVSGLKSQLPDSTASCSARLSNCTNQLSTDVSLLLLLSLLPVCAASHTVA